MKLLAKIGHKLVKFAFEVDAFKTNKNEPTWPVTDLIRGCVNKKSLLVKTLPMKCFDIQVLSTLDKLDLLDIRFQDLSELRKVLEATNLKKLIYLVQLVSQVFET